MNERVKVTAALVYLGLTWSLAAQTITEFPVPTPGPPPFNAIEIAAGPDGSLWFTESEKIGRITTAGVITEFRAPHDLSPNDITAGPDGNLWFTEWDPRKIGRITTAGVVTEFSLPTADGSPGFIATGPDGNLWFTDGNRIGRITTDGLITEFPLPTPGSGPDYIVAGPDGSLWFTEFNAHKIGRVTVDGVVTEYPIPTAHSRPNGIVAGPDGNLWFTEPDDQKIGRITTAGVVTEFPAPTDIPFEIANGPDGNLWFTDAKNKIGRITTAGVVTNFPIPTFASRPTSIAAGPDGNLWFTELFGNKIGRITTGPCNSDATTLCLGGGRFSVTADWQAPSRGTGGHGAAVRLSNEAGYFSFFDASNVEAIVKVLNGCSGTDGHYWVFAAGLTNVAVTLNVRDLQTDQTRTYTSSEGSAFEPIQDTSAFATCP